MPKAEKMEYYAVAVGRDAPIICYSWEECSAKVSRYYGAVHRKFNTMEGAEQWLVSRLAQAALNSASQVVTPTVPPRIDRQKTHYSTSNDPAQIEPDQHRPKPVVLSPEQNIVFARVKDGKNVLFTGSAGTGKSYLLQEIVQLRTSSGTTRRVAVTASTAIAALNIGGTTLHSWAGIGLGLNSAGDLVEMIQRGRQGLTRWNEVETLIIDEISMIDGALFDKLEYIARKLRNSTRPFGGIQLILCGDFFQLPPISVKDKKGRQIPAKFAFEAKSWDACIGAPMMLTKVFRQRDQDFADMLNEVRSGDIGDATVEKFKDLSLEVDYTDGIEPTELYPTKLEVNWANDRRLAQLHSEPQTYEARDWPGVDHEGWPVTHDKMCSLLDKVVAPKKLELKIGAQVMLLKNLQQGVLVNGSVGRVIRFCDPCEVGASGTKIASAEPGAAGGIKGPAIPQDMLSCNRRYPVVQFTNGETLVVGPADFSIDNGYGKMMAARVQLPLILAWALSVHKSQGQTLERVKVDLKKTFEKGQAYVALSRATNMENLQVLNFRPHKIMAHPSVLAWYRNACRSRMSLDEEDS